METACKEDDELTIRSSVEGRFLVLSRAAAFRHNLCRCSQSQPIRCTRTQRITLGEAIVDFLMCILVYIPLQAVSTVVCTCLFPALIEPLSSLEIYILDPRRRQKARKHKKYNRTQM
ncbi:hypothetical protein BDV06DRAFT_17153 [Aspergillus oleicola]